MGNWRTVQIVGTCDPADVPALHRALEPGPNYDTFHPLVCGGLMGLQNWAAPVIDQIGNLAERDYRVDDVAATLADLAKVAPSLAMKIHCGGDNEARTVVATVTLAGGRTTIGRPELAVIPERPVTQAQMIDRINEQARRQRGSRG